MPSDILWSTPSAIATLMSTELNALANNARALGGAIDNLAARNQFADFELDVTFASAPAAGGSVALYLLPALDDTNHADGSNTLAPQASLWVGNFQLRADTSAQRLVLRGVALPPLKFKPLIENAAGQSFPSSGSTLRFRTYNDQVQ